MLIHGSCHCRNLSFRLQWPDEALPIPARACGCSFCRKHGGVWTALPGAQLVLQVEHPQDLTLYAFETRTADFHVCARCGVAPWVISEIDGRRYAVVSVNAFDGVDPALLQRAEVSFEGEALDDRLRRRAARWIPL
ncbi:MAG TPA: hypothetical protein VK195_04250 [Burkholderiaceae bacterium]|nr:hypothetical protein [Burkholderiaceae bacterium]